MKVAIIQPYFFPYLGYWQIMNLVDTFVVFDDVNFIKRGWINRNRILQENGEEKLITLQLIKASQNKLINETSIGENRIEIKGLILNTYKAAPFFGDIAQLIEKAFDIKTENLAEFLTHGLRTVAHALNMQTKIVISSNIEKDNDLRGEAKILDICNHLKATKYVNPIGGRELYKHEIFSARGIDLNFLECHATPYVQHKTEHIFTPYLSILDVLMFNGLQKTHDMLADYRLITDQAVSITAPAILCKSS